MTRAQKLHGALFAVVVAGLLCGGWVLGRQIGQAPVSAATMTLPRRTVFHTRTRVLTKVVKGRVVRLKGGQRVVRVPVVVIHNLRCHPSKQNHCVRLVVVPAHTIPLRAATVHQAVAVAAPLIPITVYATVTSPPITLTLPAETVTQTQTTTETDLVTVTVTIPIPPGEAP